jgi:hypothetical protein
MSSNSDASLLREGPRSNAPVTANELYLHIYDKLQKEIASSVKQARDTERNTLLACGAILTYALGSAPHPAPTALWYLPLLLSAFGALRSGALMISIKPRGIYLRRLEELSLVNQPLEGWEPHFRSHDGRFYRRVVGATTWIFWIAIVVVTAAIPTFAQYWLRGGSP